jgi:2'-5' RNA ligase
MEKHLNYDTYRQRIREKAKQLVEPLMKKPANRYRIHYRDDTDVQFEPIAYAGYTLLARPYPINFVNGPRLEAIQHKLQDNIFGFAPVPSDSFHMTIANLVSGNTYEALSESQEWEYAFKKTIEAILNDNSRNQEETPLLGYIIGIGAFPGVIVLLVDFRSKSHYNRIERIREKIYNDPFLINNGVKCDRAFQGHITLGYLEAVPPKGLDNVVSHIRLGENFGSDGWIFEVKEVALHLFYNMSEYQLAGSPYRI